MLSAVEARRALYRSVGEIDQAGLECVDLTENVVNLAMQVSQALERMQRTDAQTNKPEQMNERTNATLSLSLFLCLSRTSRCLSQATEEMNVHRQVELGHTRNRLLQEYVETYNELYESTFTQSPLSWTL